MAKRELSSTLKNLKFMQRASQREEKAVKKEEEVTPSGDFPSTSVIKRCVVITEGDPHPGAARGRMSFLSFNPSIDKLNDEGSSQTESNAKNSGNQTEAKSSRGNEQSEDGTENMDLSNDTNGDHKRKQDDVATEEAQFPNRSKRSFRGNQNSSPSSSGRNSQKHQKCEKLDWNVLRPPKYPMKKR